MCLQHRPVDPLPEPRAQGQGGPAGGRGPWGRQEPGSVPNPVPLLAVLVSGLEGEGWGERPRGYQPLEGTRKALFLLLYLPF